MISPRQAALEALEYASQGKGFSAAYLEDWQRQSRPASHDFGLALELTAGTTRMKKALDHLAVAYGRLPKKRREKWLFRLVLYQLYFLTRIPHYAIAKESVQLAKDACSVPFSRFINAVVRKSQNLPAQLPQGNDSSSLATRYSYPEWYVNTLITEQGLETTTRLLALGNAHSPPTFARKRCDSTMEKLPPGPINAELATSPHFYLQNPTPVHLITSLSRGLPQPPKRILDLCAAPGGKTLLLRDLYPGASLWANDPSPKRLERLKENLQKYGVEARISSQRGETFESEERFDLIILDVPCSNTGVLHRRPEARWRLSEEEVRALLGLQSLLLSRAAKLLAPQGQIWLLTCSILKMENEASHCGFTPLSPPILQLPNDEGWDGGFGISLRKN